MDDHWKRPPAGILQRRDLEQQRTAGRPQMNEGFGLDLDDAMRRFAHCPS
jgi:hypothetical protein